MQSAKRESLEEQLSPFISRPLTSSATRMALGEGAHEESAEQT